MNTPTDLKIALSCVTVERDIVHLNIARHRPIGKRHANQVWARIHDTRECKAGPRDFLIFRDDSEDDTIPFIEVRNPISKVPMTNEEANEIRQAVAEWICLTPEVLLRAMIEFHEIGCEASASQAEDVRYSLQRINDLLASMDLRYDTKTLAQFGSMRAYMHCAKGLA